MAVKIKGAEYIPDNCLQCPMKNINSYGEITCSAYALINRDDLYIHQDIEFSQRDEHCPLEEAEDG